MVLAERQTYRPWNRMESSKINPHIYSQMIFDKNTKSIQWGREVFSTNGVEKTGYPHAKELIWILTLHHIQKLTQNGSKI